MRVRKRNPGASPGYVWAEAGTVLDIPTEVAAELIAINPGEFEALPDDPDQEAVTEGDPDAAPKPRAASRRSAVTEA